MPNRRLVSGGPPVGRRPITSRLLCAAVSALVAISIGCTTSALGRSQLKLLPESQLDEMGVTAFAEITQKTPLATNAAQTGYVACVATAVTRAVQGGPRTWEVRVFEDETANAFALPGGKIGVNTGLLTVARTPDQLATVLGHEVSHVLAGHSNERVSAALVTQSGLKAIEALSNASDPMHAQMLGLLGTGIEYGVTLPYSRAHETEADLLGLDLMARAGFDPRESVKLWQNMAAATGARQPEFLSTHPAPASRIRDLEGRMDHALSLAQRAGGRPQCR